KRQAQARARRSAALYDLSVWARCALRGGRRPMRCRSGLIGAELACMGAALRLTPNTIRRSGLYIKHKYIGSLFGDHIDSSNDEIAGNARKDRRIDNPEIPNAVHTEFAVDYAGLIFRFHRTGATGMMAPGVILDMSLQLIVSIQVPTGDLLFDNQTAYRIQ